MAGLLNPEGIPFLASFSLFASEEEAEKMSMNLTTQCCGQRGCLRPSSLLGFWASDTSGTLAQTHLVLAISDLCFVLGLLALVLLTLEISASGSSALGSLLGTLTSTVFSILGLPLSGLSP